MRHEKGRTGLIAIVLLCLFFIGIGTSTVINTLYTFPHRYGLLASGGVSVDGTLVKCAPGIGGGRGIGCEVHLNYEHFNRTWEYPENSPQFNGLTPGSRIPMLVDPSNPNIAYTVLDVRQRTDSGLGVLFFFGCALVVVGIAGLWWVLTLQRRVDRKVARISERFGGAR